MIVKEDGIKTIKCDSCKNKVDKLKRLKKLKDGFFCNQCIKERRKDHREFLKRSILGIRKRTDLLKEWAEKKTLTFKPQIKPVKKPFKKVSSLGIYITRDEKNVLYRKYVRMGYSPMDSSEKVDRVCDKMRDLVTKLREQKKSEQEINKKFKEEFAKLITQ
jgi:hypothetical protein